MVDDHVTRIHQQWAAERPDLDVSPSGVIGRLHRLGQYLTAELVPVFAEHGLTEGEFDVLAAIRRSGEPYELAPGEIAENTMVTTGAISKRLDRLEQGGWLERHANESDGRGRVVRLTPDGLARFDEAFSAHIANEHRLVSVLDQQERSDLERLLKLWASRLN